MNINQNYLDEISKILPADQMNQFIESCKMPLGKSMKINMHKISVEEMINITKEHGWHIRDTGFIQDPSRNDTFYIDRDNTEMALGRSFLHQSGVFYIQEVAASMPPKFIDINENELILDMSASPGGKSCQIGDYLLSINKDRPGMVISNDVDKVRLSSLVHNLNRMGIYNSAVTNFNGFSFGKNLSEVFDHVLVDAPCSGEGTGFKSDAALKFWKREEINKIAGTQFQLLVSALKSTKVGGSVIFSTCTLNPFENEFNLKRIKEFFGDTISFETVEIKNKSLGIDEFDGEQLLSKEDAGKIARFWPHIQKTGGFFISKIRKNDSFGKEGKINTLLPRNPFKLDFGGGIQKKVSSYLEEIYGINLKNKGFLFVATQTHIYATSQKFLEIKDLMQFEKIGTPILKIDERLGFIPQHGLGVVLGNLATKNFASLSWSQANEYGQGGNLADVNITKFNSKEPYIILKWNNLGMGVGKYIEGYIKNKYMKI